MLVLIFHIQHFLTFITLALLKPNDIQKCHLQNDRKLVFIDQINHEKYIKSATGIEDNMLSFFKQSVPQFDGQTFGFQVGFTYVVAYVKQNNI